MIATDILQSGYRSQEQRSPLYIAALVVTKILRTIGIFVASELLKAVHVVQLLFLLKLCSGGLLVLIQRPFTSGPRMGKRIMSIVVQHALLSCLVQILWLYGITLCGPFRSVLLFENSPVVVIASLSAFFQSSGSPSKTRGAVVFFLGFVACMLLDRDSSNPHAHAATHSHQSGLNHIFYHIIHWFGMADHKAGTLLMFIALLLNTGLDFITKRISLDVGGAKRLHAASTFVSTLLLIPWLLWTLYRQSVVMASWLSFISLLIVASVLLFVVDFYMESFCAKRLDSVAVARVAPTAMFISALIFSFFDTSNGGSFPRVDLSWFQDHHIDDGYTPSGDHAISGGSILTMMFFIFASFIQTAPSSPKMRAGQFVGYSSAGLPLYVYGEDFLQRTTQSISTFVKSTIKQVLSSSDSRRIFYFLCANLAFTFVEFAYGFWTNSLGLISDGFHMLFDCSALVMGLVAAVMTTWPSTRVFSYGYGRVETLSGFINGLFLLTVSFFIFLEAVQRMFDPPQVTTEKLLPVSIAGLVVNLFGILVFSDAHHGHSHGGSSHGHSHASKPEVLPVTSHGHSHTAVNMGHGHGHGHSHDEESGNSAHHSHGHHGHSHGGGTNANMLGVYLHILADTLGSVAVIISTLLMKYFGWLVADPICSLLLASLIFVSTLPLLRSSSLLLLQRLPDDAEYDFKEALHKVLQVDGVISYSRGHMWQQKSDTFIGTLHVQVTEESHQQRISQQVLHILRQADIKNATVQVEKNSFFQHVTALSPSYEVPQRTSRMPLQQSLMVQAI